MKKVLALVLAVMMLATVAFAAQGITTYTAKRPIANFTPGTTIKIDKTGLKDSGVGAGKDGADVKAMSIQADFANNTSVNSGDVGFDQVNTEISNAIFRSVTTTNYSISNVKFTIGKGLVSGVTINDKEERIDINLVDDLDNQTAKDFEVSFKLKGKAKFTLQNADEITDYNAYCASGKEITPVDDPENWGKKVTLPDVTFTIIGTVGYGKVEISLGDDNDEELEGLESMGVNKEDDVVKFVKGSSTNTIGNSKRVAGAYTADAILTEEYGDAMTMQARVYAGDVLYFNCENDPDRDIVGRLADSDADMDFYIFNSNTKYTTFNSNVTLLFNDAEEEDFIYQIKDGKLVKTGTWDEDEDCWVVKARTLGAYVVSDVELKEFEAAVGTTDTNPDTGANDVVGIATALAAVALVSAAAVSLKK